MNELDIDDYDSKFSDYYILVKYLGSGSFGKVVQAIEKSSGQEVAVKVINKNTINQEKISNLKKEAKILSSLNHPNIVKFIHLKETRKRLFLVMELIKGGDLQELISNKPLTELQASQVMTGVFRAVEYMHSKNVIHRDIKPENILIPSFEDLTTVKVSDFGLSSQLDQSIDHYMENENCGTLKYMAPEQTGLRFYSRPVDIWSCGILMFTLLTSRHPLLKKNESRESYIEKLKSPKWKFSSEFSQSGKSLFLKLVEIVPIDRYTATQALKHPWISRLEVKPPLTSFEKFKIYGEHLKFKGIIFPVFFACISAGKSLECIQIKKDECFVHKPPLSPVKRVKKYTNIQSGITTPSPDISLIKRGCKGNSPSRSAWELRKMTPRDLRKRNGNFTKKAKSFENA